MNRGYAGGTPNGVAGAQSKQYFNSAQDTMQEVKSSFHQWGRTATMPNGALRGAMGPPPSQEANMMSRWSSDTDTTFGSLNVNASLKRGMAEDDSDAILANCFDEDEGSQWGTPFTQSNSDSENEPLDAPMNVERAVRPLPARSGFRPTKSMPPLRELPLDNDSGQSTPYTHHRSGSDSDEAMAPAEEPFRHVDFTSYASRTDNF